MEYPNIKGYLNVKNLPEINVIIDDQNTDTQRSGI